MLDPRDADAIPGDVDPATRSEVAHTTAQALVHGGRAGQHDAALVDRLVRLVEHEGLDVVAAMWADSPATTLPGTLWRLYALRDWVGRDPRAVAEHYRAGVRSTPVHEVVAGVADAPGPDEVRVVLDEVLSGVFRGDLAVALERAGAFCRVLAVGASVEADRLDERARTLADPTQVSHASRLTSGAASLVRTAEELEHAAGLWRAELLD